MEPIGVEAIWWGANMKLKHVAWHNNPHEAFVSTSFRKEHVIQCENKCLPSKIYLVNIYFHTPSTSEVSFLPGKSSARHGCESGRDGGQASMSLTAQYGVS